MNYFEHIITAIDTLSLSAVIAAVSEARNHREHELIQKRLLPRSARKPNRAMSSHAVIDSRGEEDITPLAYACLAYALRSQKKDDIGCQKLNDIIGWMLREGANANADLARPIIRSRHPATGQPVFHRGIGQSIAQALKGAGLPKAFNDHIAEVADLRKDHARFGGGVVAKQIPWKASALVA